MGNEYFLMNKDKKVMRFRAEHATFTNDIILKEVERYDTLPYGFSDIDEWIENRKASKHNEHLKRIMKDLKCDDHEGFINLTHAANINDCFWVKKEEELTSWNDVSLYRNEFSDVVSKLAFGGLGLGENEIFSSTTPPSPELTCDGSFRKCFRKENSVGQFGSDIFVYKRRGELENEGLTPYCEVITSEIASVISPSNYVKYDLTNLHNKLSSRCNLFTDERLGYASFAKVQDKGHRLQQVFDYFQSIGSEQEFRELLVIDALCFNIDRHLGNFGILFDNETLSPIRMAPAFDFNLSMLYRLTDEQLQENNAGWYLYDLIPKLGDDFTRIGQLGMNSTIAERVRRLKDFSFSFSGDDVFTRNRLEATLNIILRQADALLSEEKMFVRDVFPSSKTTEYYKKLDDFSSAVDLLERFENIIENEYSDLYFSVSVSDEDVNTLSAILYIEKDDNLLDIDFCNKAINVQCKDVEVKRVFCKIIYELCEFTKDPAFKKIYEESDCSKQIDDDIILNTQTDGRK